MLITVMSQHSRFREAGLCSPIRRMRSSRHNLIMLRPPDALAFAD
jgi:hypothetical protein